MNKYQRFALRHYLSYWPEDMVYDEVLDLLKRDVVRDDLRLNDMYEGTWPELLVSEIENMAGALKLYF